MSVPHSGGDPNANLYAKLKLDVLDRVPQITVVQYVPDDIVAKQLRAVFDPGRLDPLTGPSSPELIIPWYRQDPHDWFRVDYTTQTQAFALGDTKTEITPTSDGRISSTRPSKHRTVGASHLSTKSSR